MTFFLFKITRTPHICSLFFICSVCALCVECARRSGWLMLEISYTHHHWSHVNKWQIIQKPLRCGRRKAERRWRRRATYKTLDLMTADNDWRFLKQRRTDTFHFGLYKYGFHPSGSLLCRASCSRSPSPHICSLLTFGSSSCAASPIENRISILRRKKAYTLGWI